MPNYCQFFQNGEALKLSDLDDKLRAYLGVQYPEEDLGDPSKYIPAFHEVQFLVAIGQTLPQIAQDQELCESHRIIANILLEWDIETSAWASRG